MTNARTAKQITNAIRKAGYPVECFKGNGYVYFVADDMREIDSIYTCYLSDLPVARYVEHVAGFYVE